LSWFIGLIYPKVSNDWIGSAKSANILSIERLKQGFLVAKKQKVLLN